MTRKQDENAESSLACRALSVIIFFRVIPDGPSLALQTRMTVSLRTAGMLLLLLTAVPRYSAVATVTPVNIEAESDTMADRDLSSLEAATAAAGLDNALLHEALAAYEMATLEGETTSNLLTVIDYGLKSRERRLWVIDLATDSVLARELVAHGRNSGGDMATQFSNRHGSNQSSLGTFVTGDTYHGKHGLSLRLHGLDEGVNDAAFDRAIVIHGADYVRESIVPQLGRLGRSLGCPALSQEAAPRIIALIKEGVVVYAGRST